MKFFVFPALFFWLISVAGYSQGILSGSVFDKDGKEEIIGAYVIVDGTTFATTTDFDGLFIIRDIPEGSYSVRISYIGMETKLVENVVIKSGQKTDLNVAMSSEATLMDEIVVVDYKKTNTDAAVLLEVKQAKQVVSAISSQQIAKSQDNNAAQVMQRVPGVTIVENRFVMVRGLPERYNNVMINNVVAPSTEVNKRTFSFDLLGSSILDKMLIYKSGSADLPGDFAGAVIKVHTVDAIDNNFVKLNFGGGYRLGTTFRPYFQSQGSPTDWLGFDNGYRSLPSDFPSTRELQNSSRNAELRQAAAHKLPNNFSTEEHMALPDFSVGISVGRNIDMKNGKRLSSINSLNYSTSYQFFDRDFFRYFDWSDKTKPITKRFAFNDATYSKTSRISFLSNWNYRASDKTRIKFKNFFNLIGENETILRTGDDFIQRPDDDLKNYLLGFNSRLIYTGQLEIDRNQNEKTDTRWVVGGSYLNESEPDLRRFRTFRPRSSSDESFTMQLPPSSNLFDTGRFYGNLKEFTINTGFDYTYKISTEGTSDKVVKLGYYADYRERDFKSRYFSYLYPGFFDPIVLQRINKLPLTEIFSNENIKTENGFVIEEGTRRIDSYNASNLLGAAYGSFEMPFKKFNLITGLRGEYNIQKLNTADDFGRIVVENPVLSLLPFVNLAYRLNSLSNLRIGYGRTVNRPEFRELAPFLFYDYELEAGLVGNSNLVTATINNFDLRYELYPRNGEVFSIGAFYKRFIKPIENRTIITTEQPQFTFINADGATNYGLELEFRKSLRGITNSYFIDRFSINANGSLIFSQVDLGNQAGANDRLRALQGQSPYIVNFALYYADNSQFSFSAAYNIFGDRIFSVGDNLFPTIYERPRHSLDLTINKQVGNKVTYKFGVQDVLNARYRFYEDSDRDEKITEKDNRIFSFRRGQLISLSISYNLF